MAKTPKRIEFRALVAERRFSWARLLQAFWRGEFEKRGRCVLELPAGGLYLRNIEATREKIGKMIPRGAQWMPPEIQSVGRDEKEYWSRLAELEEYVWDPSFLSTFFGRITIAESDLQEWLERGPDPDDAVGRRIQKVLKAAAAEYEAGNTKLQAIAAVLAERGGGEFAASKEETIRKILRGTYPPSVRRGLPGLGGWRGRQVPTKGCRRRPSARGR